jgi:low temperature requirement protein LtrA
MWFALPYVLVRLIGLLLYYWVSWSDVRQRRAVLVFGLFSLSGLASVIVGSLLGGAALYWCWTLTIALDLIAAGIGGKQEGWNLHPEHFVERHGLIVIIALGETLIVAAAGMTEAPRTPGVLATVVLTVAVLCALWWSYFPYVKPALEHEMERCEGTRRSRLARDAFSIIHFPMLCGVVAMAVAEEEILAHPEEPLSFGVRLALGVGALLFAGGTGMAMWRATARFPVRRTLVLALAAGAVLMWGVAANAALSLVLGGIIVVVLLERRSSAGFHQGESAVVR